MAERVWVVFLGSYSDRRAVAAFDNRGAAVTAAEFLWTRDNETGYLPEGVDVQALPVQSVGIGASLDGGQDVWADGQTYA